MSTFFAACVSGCGESIVTALNKIATGQICALSANELKALNKTAVDLGAEQTPPVNVPPLNDEQAQALADFLRLNELCTFEDLQGLAARIQNDEDLQGLDALAAAFGGIDPDSVDGDELQDIVESTLGLEDGG
jgi:hypothetical protein